MQRKALRMPSKQIQVNSTSTRGFTLLELLIVILVMSMLFGLGYANYKRFADRKATEDVVVKIVGELRYTQQIANSVKKPTAGNCSTSQMEKYSFILTGSMQYRVLGTCETGSFEDKEGTLSNRSDITVTKNHAQPIDFKVLGKGSNTGGTELVIADDNGNNYTVEVSETGEIKSDL